MNDKVDVDLGLVLTVRPHGVGAHRGSLEKPLEALVGHVRASLIGQKHLDLRCDARACKIDEALAAKGHPKRIGAKQLRSNDRCTVVNEAGQGGFLSHVNISTLIVREG